MHSRGESWVTPLGRDHGSSLKPSSRPRSPLTEGPAAEPASGSECEAGRLGRGPGAGLGPGQAAPASRAAPRAAGLTLSLPPAARIIRTRQWCDMLPCLEGEGCELLANRSGWTCTRHGGRRKTTTVRARPRPPAPAARGTGRPPVPSSSPALPAPAGPLSLSPTALSPPDGHRACSGPSGRQNRARGRQRRAQVAGGSVWCLGDGWLEPRGSFGWGVGGSEPSAPRPRCMWPFA